MTCAGRPPACPCTMNPSIQQNQLQPRLPGSCIICAPMHAVADEMQSAAPPKCIHVITSGPNASAHHHPPVNWARPTTDALPQSMSPPNSLCILVWRQGPRYVAIVDIITSLCAATIQYVTSEPGNRVTISACIDHWRRWTHNIQFLCYKAAKQRIEQRLSRSVWTNNSHQLQLPCPSREICTSFLISRMLTSFFI